MIVNGLSLLDTSMYILLEARKTEPNITGKELFKRIMLKHSIKNLLEESKVPEEK